jgi:DHA1 family multidrug resistance protein-like MFS transporter
MPPAFYPIYAVNKKHISLELTGLIISVQTFVSIFVSVLATKYTNKFKRNNLILFSLLISGLGNVGFVSLEFTENKNTIVVLSFICRCLSGVGLAIGNSVIYAYIPILYSSQQEHIFGILESAAAIGSLVGPAVGGLLYDLGGIILPFASIGLLLILSMPLVNYNIPNMQIQQDQLHKNQITLSKILSKDVAGIIFINIILQVSINIFDATLGHYLIRTFDVINQ